MIPEGAIGERVPAFAPEHRTIAIRNPLIPNRPATFIATGARKATVAIAPGPIEENTSDIKKKMTGIIPIRPRANFRLLCVILSSVPLTVA